MVTSIHTKQEEPVFHEKEEDFVVSSMCICTCIEFINQEIPFFTIL